jgi:Dullard-like phosphatase family protein
MVKYMLSDNHFSYQPLREEQKIKFKFKKPGFKKLLLFDLDETLIHVQRSLIGDEEFENEGDQPFFEPEVEIPVNDPYNNTFVRAGFSVRPFARQCLAFANKYFEVAVFTAGNQWFADPILDYLDKDRTLIQHRYFRQHTCQLEGVQEGSIYIKDLEILTAGEVPLNKILIIDNNLYSFAFNLENGIPVQHYLGDQRDRSLL